MHGPTNVKFERNRLTFIITIICI